MSIGIHNQIFNCYYQTVENKSVANWFIEKYLDWQRENKELNSMAEFSRYLGVGDKALNTWVNGRNNPSYKKALQVCKKLNDYSLLKILGYQQPDYSPASLDSLPEELRNNLERALGEIRETFKSNDIESDSSEAETLSVEILKKHGFIFNSNLKE